MKISFNAESLAGVLSQVSSVVNQKSPMPILADICMKTYTDGEGKVSMVATCSDGETWVSCQCELADGDTGIVIAVNAKDFVSTLRSLGGRAVELDVDEEAHTVKGKYQNGHFMLPYDNADDFPTPQMIGDEHKEIIVDAQKLAAAINATEYATANLVTKPLFNGINFMFNEDMMVAAAIDGNKIAKYSDFTVKCDFGNSSDFTVHAIPCRLIARMLSKVDGDVKLSFNESVFMVSRKEFRIVARQLCGKYPNYNTHIPTDSPIKVTVCRDDIIESIKRVMNYGNEQSELIVVTLTEGEMNLYAESAVESKSANETVKCDYDGEKFTIGFKATYMLEVFGKMMCENIVIGMSAPNMVAVVTPETQDDGTEYITLLLPMTINQIAAQQPKTEE